MKYAAFLSYNHRDRDFARWLHRSIETFSPTAEVRAAQAQAHALKPAFMDREELASSGDLAKSVREALENSEALVVICSPNAAASKWVNEEVRTFQQLGRADRIFCIVAGGDPGRLPESIDAQNESCFPPALLFDAAGKRLAEPLAADVRPTADGKNGAALKVIAGLLGVPYDTLRQREARRLQRRMWMITTASLVGFTITSGLAISAWLARNEAQKQRVIAEQKSLTAQRTVSFLKSMFGDADPSQTLGENITVGDVLRRATLQIDAGLQNEPAVRGSLLTTLGQVYTGLGSYGTSAQLLKSADEIKELAVEDKTALRLAQGDLLFFSGEYEKAIDQYKQVTSAENSGHKIPVEEREHARILIGNSYASTGKHSEARETIQQSLRAIDNLPTQRSLYATGLFAAGANEFLAGNFLESVGILEKALSTRKSASGTFHPDVAAILNMIASANFRRGQKADAERLFREVLAIDERVLGKDHPANAIKQNNIARIVIEQRKFQEAESLLSQSEQILTKQLTPDHDDFAFVYSNIALAKRGLGDDATAENYLQKTIPIARKHKHRTLGLALADLAEIECRSGRVAQGLARLDEALALAADIKPPEPWRAAYVEHIRAACTLATKSPLTPSERTDAVTALRASGEIVVKHWTAEGLYGYEAALRMKKFTK
jgi:tetratricopeptide (TPR) repeat protein